MIFHFYVFYLLSPPRLCEFCFRLYSWSYHLLFDWGKYLAAPQHGWIGTQLGLNWGRWVQSGTDGKQRLFWGPPCLPGRWERCSCVKWAIAVRGQHVAGECLNSALHHQALSGLPFSWPQNQDTPPPPTTTTAQYALHILPPACL